jgi:hypothetical protein
MMRYQIHDIIAALKSEGFPTTISFGAAEGGADVISLNCQGFEIIVDQDGFFARLVRNESQVIWTLHPGDWNSEEVALRAAQVCVETAAGDQPLAPWEVKK